MKKVIKILLTALLLATAVFSFAGCGEMDLEYTKKPDGTYKAILDPASLAGRVVFPETHKGKPVTEIDHSLGDPFSASTVIIPPTIKEVSSGTLLRFPNALEYQDGITYLSGWAIDCEPGKTLIQPREGTIGLAGRFLANNPDATTLECPSTLRYMATYALAECSNLLTVKLNEGLEYLGYGAFTRCTSLKTLILPDSLTAISSGVFWECSSLTRMVLPVSVTEVYNDTFYCCGSLTLFYKGTKEQFDAIISHDTMMGEILQLKRRCYFSPEMPSENPSNYWYYLDGYPMYWSEF